MESLELVYYPDSILRNPCVDADLSMKGIGGLAQAMIDYCKEYKPRGLAANQVGINVRVVVLNTPGISGGFVAWMNPEIIESEGQSRDKEGCLSLPGINVMLVRPNRIKVRATNVDGDRVEMELEGLAARVWQHEIDHINGKLLFDRLGSVSRQMLQSKLKRLEKWAKKNQK